MTLTQSFAKSRRTRLPIKINHKMLDLVVPWVEDFWHKQRRFPTDSEFLTQFNFGSEPGDEAEVKKLQQLKLTRQFRDSLMSRGISYNPLSSDGSQDFKQLTPEQVATISVLTNFADTRPQNIKLNALGVTSTQIQGWMVNPEFQRTLAARADEQFNNIYPEAVTSLNRRVKQGSVPAIKFYFEITGRAQAPELVNLKLAMQHLIEAVQKHVHDPEVLTAIAADFRAINEITSGGVDS